MPHLGDQTILLKDFYAPNGEWTNEIHLIKHILLNYFQKWYEAEPINDSSWDYCLTKPIIANQQHALVKSITHTKLDETIKNLAPCKAPGSYGCPTGFY